MALYTHCTWPSVSFVPKAHIRGPCRIMGEKNSLGSVLMCTCILKTSSQC